MLESPDEFRQRAGRVAFGIPLDFRSRGQVIRDLVFAVLLVAVFVAVTVWSAWPNLLPVCFALPLFGAYCTAAYFVRVRPNHDELGLDGSMLDHPLRVSDGVNRALVNLVVFLAVGRFVSVGLVDGIRLLRRGALPHDHFLEDIEPPSATR